MNPPAFSLETRQSQTLAPRLQQAVRMLQLSTLDFTQEIAGLVSNNPFLELEEPREDSAGHEGPAPASADDGGGAPEANDDFDAGSEKADWARSERNAQVRSGDAPDALDFACASTTLRQHLQSQLNMLDLSIRDRFLSWMIVETLDDDGYLRVELDSLRRLVELDPPVEDADLRFALKLVQSIDPAGVGCRDVPECIRLQLNGLPDSPVRTLAVRILEHGFRRLVQRDIPGLARDFGRTPAEIEAACNLIRGLNPRPGASFSNEVTTAIVPDIIVRKRNGRWTAMLNNAIVPQVRVNQMYADLFQRHRESHHGALASHLQEARWTVRNLGQRFSTILRVAQTVVERQWNFFELGTLAMQPLSLKDVAQALDLHESTISRATCNKYMVTPLGVFELKYFFSRALSTSQGSQCSTTAIREAIRKMIRSEDSRAPYSDAHITRLLMRQGLRVARRTVTKYRQMMNISPVEMRRQHG